MSLPTDFSAVESDGYSYLFYTRPNGTIAYLKSTTTQEGNDTTYTTSSVLFSNNTVNSAAPRISAVAYTLQGKREIRLYYIVHEETGSGFRLAELCRTNDGDWYQGELNKNDMRCKENSPFSANVENSQGGHGDLKVFFINPDGVPRVAWVVAGQTAWAQHPLDVSW